MNSIPEDETDDADRAKKAGRRRSDVGRLAFKKNRDQSDIETTSLARPGSLRIGHPGDSLPANEAGDEAVIVKLNASGAIVEILTDALRWRLEAIPSHWRDMSGALLRSEIDQLNFLWHLPRSDLVAVKLRAERDRTNPLVLMEFCAVSAPYGLTLRELDVVTMIAAGFGNDPISVHLKISRRTVDKHVERIFAKTQIWTRSGVAGLAVDQGLLKLPLPGRDTSFPLSISKVAEMARRPITDRPNVRRIVRAPILVGMPLPLQTQGRADAQEMLDGAQLAIDQLNQRGGVLDREVRLLTIDCDITDPRLMKEAIIHLAERDVAAITLGYSHPDPSIFEVASDYKAPYLHSSTLDHVVSWVREDPVRFSNIFQTCASDINYGRGMARFLNWLITTGQWLPKNRRIAVIQPPWPGLDIGLTAMDMELGGRQWSILPIDAASVVQPDWTAVVRELNRVEPSVVLFASYMVEHSIDFQRAFARSPVSALVYKLYSPSVPIYRATLGSEADGVLWATTTGIYSDMIGASFQHSFQTAYSRRPGRSQAGIAYDRINLLAGAWSRVGNAWKYSEVVADLRKTVYRGVNGAYFFGSKGQVGLTFPDDTQDASISQAHLVFQVQRGRQVILSPSPYAEGIFKVPSWIGQAERL